jgi:transcription antitermination factor NusB
MTDIKRIIATKKRVARLLAIQSIYSVIVDANNNHIDDKDFSLIIANLQNGDLELDKETIFDHKLYSQITDHIFPLINEVDELIKPHIVVEWDYENIELLIKIILRCAVFEVKYCLTPPKVVINEYTTITASFYGAKETGFVNAMIDKIVKNLDQDEGDLLEVRKKLLYQSKYRGSREMDILLEKFAIYYLDKFNNEQLKEYQNILTKNDNDLYNFIMGKEIPENNSEILSLIINFDYALNKPKL